MATRILPEVKSRVCGTCTPFIQKLRSTHYSQHGGSRDWLHLYPWKPAGSRRWALSFGEIPQQTLKADLQTDWGLLAESLNSGEAELCERQSGNAKHNTLQGCVCQPQNGN